MSSRTFMLKELIELERLTFLCVPAWKFPHPCSHGPFIHSISWLLWIRSQWKEQGRCLFGILIYFHWTYPQKWDCYFWLYELSIFSFCNGHIACPINRYSQRREGIVLKYGYSVMESLCFSNFSFTIKSISTKASNSGNKQSWDIVSVSKYLWNKWIDDTRNNWKVIWILTATF